MWIHAGMQQGSRPDLAARLCEASSSGPLSPPVSLPLLSASQETGSAASILLAMLEAMGCDRCPSLWPSRPPSSLVPQGLPAHVPAFVPHRHPASRGLQMSCIWKSEHRTCLSRQEWARNLGEEARSAFQEAWEEERALLGKASAPRA